jgi:hypothetical protein
MDEWIKADAQEAVKKVYGEYLEEKYRDDPEKRDHRLLSYETGHTEPEDRNAVERARKAYLDDFGSDQAINAARDALYAEFDREEIRGKLVHPNEYLNNVVYHNQMDRVIDLGVEERKKQRIASMSATDGLNQVLDDEEEVKIDRSGQAKGPQDPVELSVTAKFNEGLDAQGEIVRSPDQQRSPEHVQVDLNVTDKLNYVLDNDLLLSSTEQEFNTVKQQVTSRGRRH